MLDNVNSRSGSIPYSEYRKVGEKVLFEDKPIEGKRIKRILHKTHLLGYTESARTWKRKTAKVVSMSSFIFVGTLAIAATVLKVVKIAAFGAFLVSNPLGLAALAALSIVFIAINLSAYAVAKENPSEKKIALERDLIQNKKNFINKLESLSKKHPDLKTVIANAEKMKPSDIASMLTKIQFLGKKGYSPNNVNQISLLIKHKDNLPGLLWRLNFLFI